MTSASGSTNASLYEKKEKSSPWFDFLLKQIAQSVKKYCLLSHCMQCTLYKPHVISSLRNNVFQNCPHESSPAPKGSSLLEMMRPDRGWFTAHRHHLVFEFVDFWTLVFVCARPVRFPRDASLWLKCRLTSKFGSFKEKTHLLHLL